MITKKSRLQLATALCGAFIFGDVVFANAATVVFPQQQQPGKAIAMNTTDRFVLSNNLFSASYTRKAGKLRFDGCKAMNLYLRKHSLSCALKTAPNSRLPISN